MILLLDGPAAGQTLAPRRAPTFLRLVVDPGGDWDCLDGLEDEPYDGDAVHVYRIVPGTWSWVHVRPGGRFETGHYRHVADAPAADLRETAAWRAWAEAHAGGQGRSG